jgi:dipeptidyl-peptidase 4
VMNKYESNKMLFSPEEMEQRYQMAQSLMQGFLTKRVAFNTTLIPHWISDTDFFWYEREFKQGKEFRLVDARQLTNKMAFDHQGLANALTKASQQPVDANDLPISQLKWVLEPLQIAFSAFGKRWQFDAAEQHCIESPTFPEEWLISPDRKLAAFRRDYNLWVRDIGTGEERQLTRDGEPFYQYAVAASAWGTRLAKGVEAVWAPDSQRLLTLQEDKRSVKSLPLMEYAPRDGSLRPRLMGERRVAWSGDEHIDEYRFLAIEVATGKQQEARYPRVPVSRNAEGYFSSRRGWWSKDSRHAYFIDIARGGDHLARFVEFDTDTCATRVLIEEESPDTFFKLRLDSRNPIHPRPLPGSDDMLWFSERTGWGHLYLYNIKTGELKYPITKGEWVVRDIHHYDPVRRELVIQTSGRVEGRHAYYRDICRVNVDTGELTPIIASDDEYLVFDDAAEIATNLRATRDISGSKGVSPTGNYIVTTRSRVDTIPVSVLLDRDGNEILELETADVSALPEGWQWPEPVKLLAADGKTDIYGIVYRPSHFSPNQSYPILDCSITLREGGFLPAGSFTNNSVAGYLYKTSAALAELGFIVVDIYGRGTMNRSREFSKEPLIELSGSDSQADRVAGIRQLAEQYPYMDLNRVGVGGQVSTSTAISGLLGYPDFYKVGVSVAACFDLRMLGAFVGESYGDMPATLDTLTPAQTLVDNLKGKLLIIHGMKAPTVTVALAFSLIDALQQANKDFDMLVLPNDGYGMSSYSMRRCWDYLVTHLLGVEPPKNFKLVSPTDLIAARKEKVMIETGAQTKTEERSSVS